MTPNAHGSWKQFFVWLVGAFGGSLAILYLLIVLIDPYRNVPFSPPVTRPMMDVNQRWMYPPLARDSSIDSAVFGTSSIRLLEPTRLADRFGGSFAQLAMNSATAWEQIQLADLFLRHHPSPRTVIFGIDTVWCQINEEPRITDRGFPPWMYDDNPWNDLLYLLNGKAVEIAGRMVGYYLGSNRERYDDRGWANFLPGPDEYDVAKARTHIYGSPQPSPLTPPTEPPPPAEQRAAWAFPTHVMLNDFLARLPEATTKIVLFVPYHAYLQQHPNSPTAVLYDECKSRLTAVVRQFENAHLVDFMIPSPITSKDENYWDSLHYGIDTARVVVDLLAGAVLGKRVCAAEYRYVAGSNLAQSAGHLCQRGN